MSGFGHRCAVGCWRGLVLLWLAVVGTVWSQSLDLQPESGLAYFAVEEVATGRIVQRGQSGGGNVVFDRLILAPETRFRAWVLQAATLRVGAVEFTTPSAGLAFRVPDILLGTSLSFDGDQDGLHDDGEFILGTNPGNADSDGDGISDGAEARQGTDPLEGTPARTGIIGSADTPGVAVDVAALNDVVVIGDSDRGVMVFNVFNAMDPVIIAQVNTPGTAQAVAMTGTTVAVGDGPAGLALIDVSDPPASFIREQINLGAPVTSVAADANLVFAGLASGEVVLLDSDTASVVARSRISSRAIQDLALAGDFLYVLTDGRLDVVGFGLGVFEVRGGTGTTAGVNTANGRMRLFVGGDIAYAVHRRGFSTVDVSDPTSPRLVTGATTPQFGWKQIVVNGSGLGIAAMSPNQAFDGPHNVSVFDVSDPSNNNAFVTEFETPGVARAVTIFNGIAYVADHTAGLQVINYLAFDANGVAPEISLQTNAVDNAVEEGKAVRLTAEVSDDVQVRNVEFFLDGSLVGTDGNFPFEIRVVAPPFRGEGSTMTVQARASDTGGNFAFSESIELSVLLDATPPRVTDVFPRPESVIGDFDVISALFSEPMNVSSLREGGLSLEFAGEDVIFGTADDELVSTSFEYRDSINTALLRVTEEAVLPGLYRGRVTRQVVDLAGNALQREFTWTFRIFGLSDLDADGVPDDLEPVLGFNPNDSDSDDDGTLDGDEDADGDGLSNAGEVLLGSDPLNPDSDDDGIPDGEEDSDNDGLTDGVEIARGTNPTSLDSDGDTWPDGDELEFGGDPLDRAVGPEIFLSSLPPVSLQVSRADDLAGQVFGVVTTSPPVEVQVSSPESGPGGLGVVVSLPRVDVQLTVPDNENGQGLGVAVSSPPVLVQVSSPATLGTAVSLPPVSVQLSSPESGESILTGPFIGQPPVTVEFENQ
jgi:hypothetical protein